MFSRRGLPVLTAKVILIVGTGACAPDAIEAGERLAADGVTVVDPAAFIPISSGLVMAAD